MKKLLLLGFMALVATLSTSSCVRYYPVPMPPPRVVYRTPPPRYNPPPPPHHHHGRGRKRRHYKHGR